MNRFFVKILSRLVLVTALWTLPANRLFADECGCAKHEVEIWYEHALHPGYEIIEVKPENNPFRFEIGKVRSLTLDPIEDIDFERLALYGITQSAIEMTLFFPHCSIEYSEDEGENWFRASNLKLIKDFWSIQTVQLRITAGPKDDARDSASSGGSGGSGGSGSSGGFGSSGSSGSGSSGGFGSSGGSVAPGLPANVSTSPASFHRAEGLHTVPVPAGFGLEIPMGDARTLLGYRSAGHLVSYGPLDGTAASPGKLKLNMIGEVAGLTREQDAVDAATGNTEKHYVAPFGVFRVRGWNSQSQEPASLAGASATLVEVYERDNYFAESKTFQGLPHSYYRLEGLPSGIQLVQSNFGIVSTRSWQMTGEYSITETDGFQTTVTQTVPPANSDDGWSISRTTTRDDQVISFSSEHYTLSNILGDGSKKRFLPTRATDGALTLTRTFDEHARVLSEWRSDGDWSVNEYYDTVTTTYSPWLSSTYNPANKDASLKTVTQDYGRFGRITIKYLGTARIEVNSNTTTPWHRIEQRLPLVINVETGGSGLVRSFSLLHWNDEEINDPPVLPHGRPLLTWDEQGVAKGYSYGPGTWDGTAFTPDPYGHDLLTAVTTGHVVPPATGPVGLENFHVLDSHSTRDVTITSAAGIVREESLVRVDGTWKSVKQTDYHYEAGVQQRLERITVNDVETSTTVYHTPYITRVTDEEGIMTETEVNSAGETIRTTTSGNAAVPGATTTYSRVGNKLSVHVNGALVSEETRDQAGRVVSSKDAIGVITTTEYTAFFQDPENGSVVTRSRPCGETPGETVETVEKRHFDGRLKSVTGNAVIPRYYTYSPGDLVVGTRITLARADSPRFSEVFRFAGGLPWMESHPDPAGGAVPVSTLYSYFPYSAVLSSTVLQRAGSPKVTYNGGEPVADRVYLMNPDSNSTLPPEVVMGFHTVSGYDLDASLDNSPGVLFESNTVSYVSIGETLHRKTISKSYSTPGTAGPGSGDCLTRTTLEALKPVAVNDQAYGAGLSWISSVSNGVTTVTTVRNVFRGDAVDKDAVSVVTTDDSATTASPDSVTVMNYGRMVSRSAYGSTNPETMRYDAAGHLIRHVSATGAVTTHKYNAAGQLESTMDHEGKVTTYQYHPASHQNAGLLWKTTNPESETIETHYNKRGQITETMGNGAYRVTYGYNEYGDMAYMLTYRDASSTGDLTQWIPYEGSGLLQKKIDANNNETEYTYHSTGQLYTRKWARSGGAILTTYSYSPFGDLTGISHSDDTPAVTITPDLLGRAVTISDASGTRDHAYHPVTGALDLVTYRAGGLLADLAVDYAFHDAAAENPLRPAGYSVSGDGPSSAWNYDPEGRLKTVSSGGNTHTHTYKPGTGVLATMQTKNGASIVLTRTLNHDRMLRLRGIETKNGAGTVLSRHGYILDGAGRREKATRENGQRWDYFYDPLGQVTAAEKKFPDGTAIPGHTFTYSYDGIGNRLTATHGGEGTVVTYPEEDTNALNQYTKITTEGGRFILGEAPAANAVTINVDTASRAGGLGFYWKQITEDNSTSPLWSNDSVVSNGVTISGKTWTPEATVMPVHDLDGNLTYDGRWDYSWDAENRLTTMTTSTAAADAGVPRQKLEFVYDSQGRRISKTVSTLTDGGTTWTPASSRRFLYDGWNLIAEYLFSPTTEEPARILLDASHAWGIDLSGSMQGAGGVGGLLSSNLISQSPSSNVPYFPSYDGNGNISAWIDAAGNLLARMDYSPFGQLIALYKFTAGTTLSRLNFGFSTKFTDAESGLLYYGYRYYDPVAGRWLSKDPIGERGGVNLYSFLSNQSVRNVDVLGRNKMEIDAGFGFSGHLSGLDSLDGFFADMAGGRSNPSVGAGRDGESLMNYLKNSSKDGCCIKNLRLASHGGPNGLGGGGDIEKRVGFYIDKNSVPKSSAVDFENIPVSPGFSDADVLNYTSSIAGIGLQQIMEEINNGSRKVAQKPILHKADPGAADIKDLSDLINSKAVKFCGKCEIHIHACYQSDRFVGALAKATGCAVYYQSGSCMPGGGRDPNQSWTGSSKFKSIDKDGNITNHGKTHYPPKF